MNGDATDMHAMLDAWRQQGADRMDPVRFECIAALARRAAGQTGRLRDLLDDRVSARAGAYAADLAGFCASARRDDAVARADGTSTRAVVRPRSALSTLLDHLTQQAAAGEAITADAATSATVPAWSRSTLDTLDDVRRLSTRARSQSQLRQALEHAPENAGPLNSASLVHRALGAMHEASPEYLHSFLAYIDMLASLEGMQTHGPRAAKSPAPAAVTTKRARGKARSRSA